MSDEVRNLGSRRERMRARPEITETPMLDVIVFFLPSLSLSLFFRGVLREPKQNNNKNTYLSR